MDTVINGVVFLYGLETMLTYLGCFNGRSVVPSLGSAGKRMSTVVKSSKRSLLHMFPLTLRWAWHIFHNAYMWNPVQCDQTCASFSKFFFRQSSIFSMTKWRWGYSGIRKFWPDTKDYISMCTNMAGTKTCLAVTWKFNAHFAIHPPISHLVYLSNKHQVTVFVLYMETK